MNFDFIEKGLLKLSKDVEHTSSLHDCVKKTAIVSKYQISNVFSKVSYFNEVRSASPNPKNIFLGWAMAV